MKTRIGINGFGRMGRLVLRVAWDMPELEIVHINEIGGGADMAAHLLEFDSLHGRWSHSPAGDGDALVIGDQRIGYSQHGAPGEVPWDRAGAEIVLECSGAFRARSRLAPYFDRGVRKVIVAAPVKEPDVLNVVMGSITSSTIRLSTISSPLHRVRPIVWPRWSSPSTRGWESGTA